MPGNLSFLVDLSVSAWVCRLWGLWWCTSEYLPLFLPWDPFGHSSELRQVDVSDEELKCRTGQEERQLRGIAEVWECSGCKICDSMKVRLDRALSNLIWLKTSRGLD